MRDQASLVCSFIHSTNIDFVSGRFFSGHFYIAMNKAQAHLFSLY